jgi:DNA-binding GntR family transcriptional regulator
MRTTEELERAAYVAGDAKTAELLARIAELEEKIEEMEEKIANDSLSEWNRRNGDAEQYKDFFHDCFYRLNGHYRAPDVSSDYDKSVIFAAIERGEGVAE